MENLVSKRLRHITWGDRYGVLTDACRYLDRVWYDRVMPFKVETRREGVQQTTRTRILTHFIKLRTDFELDTCRVPCRVVRILELCVEELSRGIEKGQHLGGDAMFPLLAFCSSRSNLALSPSRALLCKRLCPKLNQLCSRTCSSSDTITIHYYSSERFLKLAHVCLFESV